jgi:hypothetical protein
MWRIVFAASATAAFVASAKLTGDVPTSSVILYVPDMSQTSPSSGCFWFQILLSSEILAGIPRFPFIIHTSSGIFVFISLPTGNIHLTASVCNAPA